MTYSGDPDSSLAAVVTVTMMVLMTCHLTSACSCRQCQHYSNPVQKCRCCVYHMVGGKRSVEFPYSGSHMASKRQSPVVKLLDLISDSDESLLPEHSSISGAGKGVEESRIEADEGSKFPLSNSIFFPFRDLNSSPLRTSMLAASSQNSFPLDGLQGMTSPGASTLDLAEMGEKAVDEISNMLFTHDVFGRKEHSDFDERPLFSRESPLKRFLSEHGGRARAAELGRTAIGTHDPRMRRGVDDSEAAAVDVAL